ncbi:MAG: hypothetical protein LBP20_00765 [Treponema sp.]|jgi:hypothetical protein|nr:hypothetical protein [Treponema sp.]
MNVQNTSGMSVSRSLRWGLLAYETFRLVVLIRVMTRETVGGAFPSLIFGAANTLFVLMALFLAADFYRYSVYASLYAAGKIVSVITLISCGFFRWNAIIEAIILRDAAPLIQNLLIITLGDLLSAGGGIFLALRRAENVKKNDKTIKTAVEFLEKNTETGGKAGENGGI